MPMPITRTTVRAARMAATAAAALLLCLPAWADGGEHGEGRESREGREGREGRTGGRRVPPLPAYQQECASCHVAFPPGMLPAASWRRLMSGLPRHFGTDASLDPASVKALSDWLVANAQPARAGAAAPPEDRLTRGAAFQRAHHELDAAVWQRPAVRRATNCAACHPRADQGDFNEHAVRIPR